MVVANLGNGASLCAITNGRSVLSTMEIPALDRLPNTVKVDAAQSEEIYHLREHHTFETREADGTAVPPVILGAPGTTCEGKVVRKP